MNEERIGIQNSPMFQRSDPDGFRANHPLSKSAR